MTKYEAIYIPGEEVVKGFESIDAAWDWVADNRFCDECRKLWYNDGEGIMCSGEWEVDKEGWEDDNIEHRMTKIIVHRYYDNEDPEIERYLQDHESEVVFKGILADSQELNTLLIQLGIV